jgi:hypothetical protein
MLPEKQARLETHLTDQGRDWFDLATFHAGSNINN